MNGTWSVQPGDQVFVGYRMQEQFGGDTVEHTAVGGTPADERHHADRREQGHRRFVQGRSYTTDQRPGLPHDRYIKTNGLETDQFPEATFVLSDPITFDAPAPGTVMNTNATGDLTIHGVTKRVTIPLMARWNGDTIDLSGGTGIVLADYGMHPLSVAGFVKTADHGSFDCSSTSSVPDRTRGSSPHTMPRWRVGRLTTQRR